MASLTRHVSITMLGNAVVPLAAFFTAPILAQTLGVEGRGAAGAAVAPFTLGLSLFTMGLPEALTYYVSRGARPIGAMLLRASAAVLVIGLLAVAGFIALADVLAGGSEVVASLIPIAVAMLVPALLLSLVRGVAQGLDAWGLVAWERTIGAMSRLGLAACLAATGNLTVLTATLLMSATTLLGVFAYLPVIGRVRRRSSQARSEGAGAQGGGEGRGGEGAQSSRGLLGYGGRVWFGAIAGILLSRVDQLLLLPLSDVREVGLYVVAVQVADLVLVFNNAIRDVMFRAESADPRAARLASASRLSTMLTGATALGVGVVSIWMLPILFGQEFAAALPVLVILLVGTVLGNPGSVAGVGLSSRGRPGLRSWSLLIACIASVSVLFLLAPSYGAVGAAIATLVGNIVAGGLNLVWLQKHFSIPMRDFLRVDAQDLTMVGEQLRKAAQRGARR
ncbi:oligosaccharide flippase family protein [Brevibacterium album]|uniref:oligosaccharide flippase family protein n=1 Tax=Brevibacterium album TaxID=417948 RepID=UPI0003F8C498|nr:oligosaccharide flippase family protein [Brevibacterium album]